MNRFVIISCIVSEHREGLFRRKQLMGSMVNLLTAKLPGIKPAGLSVSLVKQMAVDVDALAGFLFLG